MFDLCGSSWVEGGGAVIAAHFRFAVRRFHLLLCALLWARQYVGCVLASLLLVPLFVGGRGSATLIQRYAILLCVPPANVCRP